MPCGPGFLKTRSRLRSPEIFVGEGETGLLRVAATAGFGTPRRYTKRTGMGREPTSDWIRAASAAKRLIIGRSAGLELFLKAVVRPDAARAVALVSRRTFWESIARCTRVWSIDLERAAVHTAALISFSFISFFSAAGAVLIAAVAHVHCRPPN